MKKIYESYNSKDYFSMIVGKEIARHRKEAGFSGGQLANMINISQQQVSRYERGICQITISLLCVILKVLNIPINDFFSGVAERIKRNQPEIYQKFETIFRIDNSIDSSILSELLYSSMDKTIIKK